MKHISKSLSQQIRQDLEKQGRHELGRHNGRGVMVAVAHKGVNEIIKDYSLTIQYGQTHSNKKFASVGGLLTRMNEVLDNWKLAEKRRGGK